MKKLLVLFLAASFILWILPLGIFIKPSQEKLSCNGQRAICMCRALVPKSSDKAMEPGIALKAGTANKENSSSGAGNYFVSAKTAVTLGLRLPSFFENQHLPFNEPCLATLEHVPKF